MARTILCDNQDGREAAFLVTQLVDGTTVGLCQDDLLPFAMAYTEQLLQERGGDGPALTAEPDEPSTEAGPAEEPASAFPPAPEGEAEPARGPDDQPPPPQEPEPPDRERDAGLEPGAQPGGEDRPTGAGGELDQ